MPALDKDREKILGEWNKVPLDVNALKLIDESRTSRTYLHRGSKLPHCDWSLDYEDGIGVLLPHLQNAVTLAHLAALHARHEFEQGHWKTGAEDVTALLRLTRHLEMEPLLIHQLVAYSIEMTAIQAAAPYLEALKQAIPETASAVLDAPPEGATLPQMVLKEKQIGPMWLIQQLKEAEQRRPGSWQDFWKKIFAQEEGPDRDLAESVKTFGEAIKRLEDGLPLYDQLANLVILPWKELDAQLPEFFKKAKAGMPLASVWPDVGGFSASERRHETQLALFKAALAVVQGGPDKLKDIKDPYGDGPFAYRALGRGFELKSTLLYKGKPVTLVVGQRTNE